jgi:hypothetical protein
VKNKTLATWLCLLGGPLGLHRFYLVGWRDALGWSLPLPTLLGAYGMLRVRQFGLDDNLGPLLVPLIGFTVAGCALTAIVYGLSTPEKWNARFNPGLPSQSTAGTTGWLTIAAVVSALLVGATVLIGTLAYGFQTLFERNL